jgi:hypothetical protein
VYISDIARLASSEILPTNLDFKSDEAELIFDKL